MAWSGWGTVILMISLAASRMVKAENAESSIALRLGSTSVQYQSLESVVLKSLPTQCFELASSLNRRLSFVSGYRQAYNSDAQRNQLQTGYLNLRFFPQYVGVIADQEIDGARYRFSPKMTYFLESGVTMGKTLIRIYDLGGGLEASTDYQGFQLGAGLAFSIVDSVFLQIVANQEQIASTGAFKAKGSNRVVQAGVMALF